MDKTKKALPTNSLFGKQNYIIMLAGIVLIAIGFLLMAGGNSADPKVFNEAEINSTRRITVAPFLIVLGFVLQIVGILRKPKAL
jgi:uncharacterized membrane protein